MLIVGTKPCVVEGESELCLHHIRKSRSNYRDLSTLVEDWDTERLESNVRIQGLIHEATSRYRQENVCSIHRFRSEGVMTS